MRGADEQPGSMFSYVSLEERVRKDHPLRAVRQITDRALERLSPRFDALYVHFGRPSVAPEKLLRALLLQELYTIRCERGPVRRVFGRGTRTRRRSGCSNPTVDFHGQRRTNATHHSTTDPDARLYKKAGGREARLGYLGHVLIEHRSGLIVQTAVTPATGHGERDAALVMI